MSLTLIKGKEKDKTLRKAKMFGDILYGEEYIIGRFNHRKNKDELLKEKDIFYLTMGGIQHVGFI